MAQVPYEQLRKSVKHSNKYLEVQITNILDKINRCVKAAEANEISPEKATETLVELTEQLENMKRKVCVWWIWILVYGHGASFLIHHRSY